MKFLVLFSLVVLPFCVIHGTHGSKIVFETTPGDVKDGLTRTLQLRCSLHDTAASASVVGRRDVSQTSYNVAEVSSIIVMRNGKDVASVSHNSPANVIDGSTNLHVSGSVSGSSGEIGFLELTYDLPTSNDTGEFQCEVNAVHGGHGIIFTSSHEVTVSTPTIADLVAYIRQNDKEKEQLQQELNQLKNQFNTTILFSAGVSKPMIIPAGQTVTYDKTYTNIGGGYNEKTGEFVCTTPGYYHFSFSAYIDGGHPHAFLILYHNTEAAFAMFGTVTSSADMLSNSGILTLARGDVVKVVSFNQSHIYNNNRDVYATFSGHLLAMI